MNYALLTVVTAAEQTALTTVQAFKDEMGITTADEDVWIEAQINRMSAAICSYIDVPAATNGTRTLGRETLSERFRYSECKIVLARVPVSSIVSVTDFSAEIVDPAEYELDGATGFLWRLTTGTPNNRISWTTENTIVYQAGYLLPGQDGRDLPYDIEDAALSMMKSARASRTRDPLVKSLEVYDVESVSYWVGSTGSNSSGGLPPDIAAKLDPYRQIFV